MMMKSERRVLANEFWQMGNELEKTIAVDDPIYIAELLTNLIEQTRAIREKWVTTHKATIDRETKEAREEFEASLAADVERLATPSNVVPLWGKGT